MHSHNAESPDGLVSYELKADVALVGLNRESKRNAISEEVLEALDRAVSRARTEAKAAILYGHGEHFCAGLDLAKIVETRSVMEDMRYNESWHSTFDRIQFGPIPWFNAIGGACVGAGLELAAATHVRIADETAFFALPEGTRGIFVGGGGSVRCSRLMGVARMTDMMLTGRSIDAQTAERWNLIQYIVEPGQALKKAMELAESAVKNTELSNFAILNALPRIREMSHGDGLLAEALASAVVCRGAESEERVREFLDKGANKVSAPTDER